MGDLRAGLIGLGMMGRNHARVLRSLPGVDLVGVADANPALAANAPGVPFVNSLEELIGMGLDYCTVVVPTDLHEQVALALADAGVHAFIEKPLAPISAAAQRIATAFADKGLVGAVGHIERFNSALQSARSRIAEGQLGSIYQVCTRRQGPFPGRISDVGVVLDLASHDIDLSSWVVQQDFVTVSARTGHRSGRVHEDLVAAVCTLADGTVTNHLVNWLSPFKEREVVILGERGALIANTLTSDLSYFENASVPSEWDELAQFRGVSEGNVVRYAIPKPEPLRTEHEHFRDAVLGKDSDIVTLDQGKRTVEVAEAWIASARDGAVINVETVTA